MKNFKEIMDEDLEALYNTEEFAVVKRIKCNGIEKSIPVICGDDGEEKRKALASEDHAEGISRRQTDIRIRLKDLGEEPKQGARFWMDEELFIVSEVKNEYNELILTLERFDQ